MSECVVRMEIPTKENPCKIAVSMQLDGWTFWMCPILNQRCLQPEGEDCPGNCPIICSLPEGHGRLVDIDQKFLRVATDGHGMSWNWRGSIADMIDKDNMRGVEIIVPAERSETDV